MNKQAQELGTSLQLVDTSSKDRLSREAWAKFFYLSFVLVTTLKRTSPSPSDFLLHEHALETKVIHWKFQFEIQYNLLGSTKQETDSLFLKKICGFIVFFCNI